MGKWKLLAVFLLAAGIGFANQDEKRDSLIQESLKNTRDPRVLGPLSEAMLQYQDAEMQARGHFIRGLQFNYAVQAEQAAQEYKAALKNMEPGADFDARFTYPMVLRNLGIAYYRSSQFAAGDSSFSRLRDWSLEVGDSLSYALAIKSMSNAQMSQENYDSAIVLMREAILIYEELEYQGIPLAYLSMGSIFGRMSQEEEALFWFRKALKRSSKLHDERAKGRILNNIAVAQRNSGNLDSAQYYLKQALSIQEGLGSIYDQVEIKGNLARNYLEMQDYPQAQKYVDEALDAVDAKNPRANRILQNMWILKLDLAIALQEPDEVKKWKAILEEKLGAERIQSDWQLLERIAKSFELLEESDSALAYFKSSQNLKEELEQNQNAELIKKAANDIELVGLKKEQEALKSRYRTILSYSLIGALVLLMVLAIIGRQKRKQAKEQMESFRDAAPGFQVEDRTALDKVKAVQPKEKSQLKLKSKAVVHIEEILYLQSEGHYLNVFIQGKAKPEIDRGSLKSMEEELANYSFQRIHRSYLVNCEHLKAVYASKVLLSDGNELPVSRTYKDELQARYKAQEDE